MLSGRCTALYSLAMVHVQPGHSAQAAPVPDVLGTRGAGAALPVSFKLGLNIKPATGPVELGHSLAGYAYACRHMPCEGRHRIRMPLPRCCQCTGSQCHQNSVVTRT